MALSRLLGLWMYFYLNFEFCMVHSERLSEVSLWKLYHSTSSVRMLGEIIWLYRVLVGLWMYLYLNYRFCMFHSE
jgi:hypothetical protein